MIIAREKKEVTTIIGVCFILNILIFIFDESHYSFDFLWKSGELHMLLVFTIIFSIVPFAIYGFTGDKNPHKSFRVSLIGFLPQLALLCWLIFA